MFSILLGCLLISDYTVIIDGVLVKSSYLKTRVIEEKCFEDFFVAQPFEVISGMRNSMSCSLICSEREECRRFLFNRTSKECSLYNQGEHCLVDEGNGSGCSCFRKEYTCLEDGTCRCPVGFYGPKCQRVITHCSGHNITWPGFPDVGDTFIQPLPEMEPFEVFCFHNKIWLKIQSRYDQCSWEDFNRTYEDYVKGFGVNGGNAWLGLKKMYAVVHIYSEENMILQVRMMKGPGTAMYDHFAMGNENSGYSFQLGSRLHFPADGFLAAPSINNTKFSTYDQDHTSYNCPARFGGGFWYADDPLCGRTNMNGFNTTWNGEYAPRIWIALCNYTC